MINSMKYVQQMYNREICDTCRYMSICITENIVKLQIPIILVVKWNLIWPLLYVYGFIDFVFNFKMHFLPLN